MSDAQSVSPSKKNCGDHHCGESRSQALEGIGGESTGKWLEKDVPKSNWVCTNVKDIGRGKRETCEMCEKMQIRYVHKMKHNNYESLDMGCICAGHMEGNKFGAAERERYLKNRASRRKNWVNLILKTSDKGNSYRKAPKNRDDPRSHVVIIPKSKYNTYSAFIKTDGENEMLPGNRWFATEVEAKLAAFDYIWPPSWNQNVDPNGMVDENTDNEESK
jgi:hypothetical protein